MMIYLRGTVAQTLSRKPFTLPAGEEPDAPSWSPPISGRARADLLLPPRQHVLRRDVTCGAVQWVPADLARAYATAGRKTDATRLLSELMELSRLIRVDPAVIAHVHTALGDKDRAFEWLAKGLVDRPSTVMRLKVDPRLDPLRNESRFQDLVQRLGLEKLTLSFVRMV